MKEAFVNISGIRTKITTYGTWIEETIKPNEHIVIIIPGNPGVNNCYNTFAQKIHDKLGYSVWIVGHAGHNIPENSIDPLPKESPVYGLKGQIQHKLDFLMKYVPQDATVHLIGHSIGSYMILEILDHEFLKKTVSNSYLLFPTIEYMKETDNGKFLTGIIKHIVWLILIVAWIFCSLPTVIQNILITIYCFVTNLPKRESKQFILNLVNPDVLQRVFLLAYEEMDEVRERNNQVIINNIHKLHFLYGEKDGWAPKAYYSKLLHDLNNVKADIVKYNHAFVLKQSTPVADIVSEYLTRKI